MSSTKTALIVGATGLVGGHCLKFLLEDDFYQKVVAVGRRSLPIESPKLIQHVIDFDQPEKYADLLVADDIYCCLGTTIKKAKTKANFRKVDYTYPVEIGKIALKNGATTYLIVSAMGANKRSIIFYNKVKGEVEAAIENLGYKTVHIFRPSLLLGERKETRIGEELGSLFFSLTAPLYVGPLKKYKAIEGGVVAYAMVSKAKDEQPGTFIHESNKIQAIYNAKH